VSGSRDRSRGCSCRRRRRSRYRRTLHRQTPSALLVLDPRPLQRANEGVAKVLGEEAVNVKRDRVIDHFQQIGQRTEHLQPKRGQINGRIYN